MIPQKIHGDNRKPQVTTGWGKRNEHTEHRSFLGNETTQCNTESTGVNYVSLAAVKIHSASNTRRSPDVGFRVWVIMMYWHPFTGVTSMLLEDSKSGRGWIRAQTIWKPPAASATFAINLELLSTMKSILKGFYYCVCMCAVLVCTDPLKLVVSHLL